MSLINENTFALCGILWLFRIQAETIVTLLVYNVMPALRNDCQPINATHAQALYELTNPLVEGAGREAPQSIGELPKRMGRGLLISCARATRPGSSVWLAGLSGLSGSSG